MKHYSCLKIGNWETRKQRKPPKAASECASEEGCVSGAPEPPPLTSPLTPPCPSLLQDFTGIEWAVTERALNQVTKPLRVWGDRATAVSMAALGLKEQTGFGGLGRGRGGSRKAWKLRRSRGGRSTEGEGHGKDVPMTFSP